MPSFSFTTFLQHNHGEGSQDPSTLHMVLSYPFGLGAALAPLHFVVDSRRAILQRM